MSRPRSFRSNLSRSRAPRPRLDPRDGEPRGSGGAPRRMAVASANRIAPRAPAAGPRRGGPEGRCGSRSPGPSCSIPTPSTGSSRPGRWEGSRWSPRTGAGRGSRRWSSPRRGGRCGPRSTASASRAAPSRGSPTRPRTRARRSSSTSTRRTGRGCGGCGSTARSGSTGSARGRRKAPPRKPPPPFAPSIRSTGRRRSSPARRPSSSSRSPAGAGGGPPAPPARPPLPPARPPAGPGRQRP